MKPSTLETTHPTPASEMRAKVADAADLEERASDAEALALLETIAAAGRRLREIAEATDDAVLLDCAIIAEELGAEPGPGWPEVRVAALALRGDDLLEAELRAPVDDEQLDAAAP